MVQMTKDKMVDSLNNITHSNKEEIYIQAAVNKGKAYNYSFTKNLLLSQGIE